MNLWIVWLFYHQLVGFTALDDWVRLPADIIQTDITSTNPDATQHSIKEYPKPFQLFAVIKGSCWKVGYVDIMAHATIAHKAVSK